MYWIVYAPRESRRAEAVYIIWTLDHRESYGVHPLLGHRHFNPKAENLILRTGVMIADVVSVGTWTDRLARFAVH